MFCFVFTSALNATNVVKRIYSRLQNEDEGETVDSTYTVRQVLNPNSRKQKHITAKSLVLLNTTYLPLTKVLNIVRKCRSKGIFESHHRANSKVWLGEASSSQVLSISKDGHSTAPCIVYSPVFCMFIGKVHRNLGTINMSIWCCLLPC